MFNADDEMPNYPTTRKHVRWEIRGAGVNADDNVIDFISRIVFDAITTAYQVGHNAGVKARDEEIFVEDATETPAAPKPTTPHWSMP